MPQARKPATEDEKPADAQEVADQKVEAPSEDDASLSVERLINESAAALGTINGRPISSADVAGAFYGENPSTEVSIKDAKARVRSWLKADEQKEN